MVKGENRMIKDGKLMKNLIFQAGLKHCGRLVVYIITSLVLNVIVIIGNEYIARATDMLLSGGKILFDEFFLPLILMIITGTIITYINSISGNNYSAVVQLDIKEKLGEHLLKLPYAYFDDKGTGSIMTKLISDINDVGRFFSEIFPNLIVDVITVTTISCYIWVVDFRLMMVLIITYPALLVVSDKLSKKLTSVVKKRKTSLDARTQLAYDAIQGIEVVRAYNLTDVMQSKIDYYIDDVAEQGCKSTKITSMGYVLRHLVNTIPVVVCYMFALYETINGNMTAGDMLAFSVLLNRIVWPLGELVFCFNDIREINVSLTRLQEIYAQDAEKSGTNIYSEKEYDGTIIEFENVKFSYDDEHMALDDMSFKIESGSTVAFAGGSGEGKSTIFKILCGFYFANEGSYKLCGHKFSDWNLGAARQMFSYVSQNVFLFPDSIWKNVAVGKNNATKEEVIEACKIANIHNFIMNLPDNYDTVVGERGVKLSGGERQRISIARAFLKNAPILLLDEPTSAVDAGTENLLADAIKNVSQNKTVIIIAHRLSTICNADKIYVVDQGKIAEEGSHQKLLSQGGIYARMYSKEVGANNER